MQAGCGGSVLAELNFFLKKSHRSPLHVDVEHFIGIGGDTFVCKKDFWVSSNFGYAGNGLVVVFL